MRNYVQRGVAFGTLVLLAACGGGGGTGPIPHTSASPAPTPCPSGYVGTAPNCTQGAQGTITPSAQATSAPLPATAGFSGTITVPAAQGSGAITVTASAQAPSGTAALQSSVRSQGRRVAATAGNTPLLYVSFAAASAITLNGLPGYSISIPSSVTLGGSVYVAQYEGSQWVTVLGPAQISNQAVTIASDNTTLALASGTPVYFCIYSGTLDNVPNPFPALTFTLQGSSSSTITYTGYSPRSYTHNVTEVYTASPQNDGTIDVHVDGTDADTATNHHWNFTDDNYYAATVANGSVSLARMKYTDASFSISSWNSDGTPATYETYVTNETYNAPYPVVGSYPFAQGTIAGGGGNGGVATTLATPQPGTTQYSDNETHVFKSDGSGTDTDVTSSASAPTTTTVTTINPDGSASVDSKASTTETVFTFGLPTAPGGTIPVTTTRLGSTSTADVPNWLPSGIMPNPLWPTTVADEGQVALPASCNLTGVTQAWDIRESDAGVDPVLGEVANNQVDQYFTQSQGEVCYTVTASFKYYNNGYTFFGSTTAGTLKEDDEYHASYGLATSATMTASRRMNAAGPALASAIIGASAGATIQRFEHQARTEHLHRLLQNAARSLP